MEETNWVCKVCYPGICELISKGYSVPVECCMSTSGMPRWNQVVPNSELSGSEKTSTNTESLAIALWDKVVEISINERRPDASQIAILQLVDEWHSAKADVS